MSSPQPYEVRIKRSAEREMDAVDDSSRTVEVVAVGHRREVYRER